MRRGLLCALVPVALGTLLVAPTRSFAAQATSAGKPASSQSSTPGHVPQAVDTVATAGEDAYDLVKARSWAKARSRLTALKNTARELPSSVDSAQRQHLGTAIATLGQAITSRDRRTGMEASNQITMIAASMSAPFRPRVPAQVAMLDYYGRELEIWSEAGNTAKLKGAATGLSETWRSVRPQVQAHGGSTVAQRFDALVKRAEAARTPAQYRRLATPILDEVDHIERVFQR